MTTAYLPEPKRTAARSLRRKRLIAFGSAAALSTLSFLLFPEFINTRINPVLWVAANAALLWTYAALIFYWAVFYFGFRWREQRSGSIIIEQASSLVLLSSLSIIGIFFSPTLPNQWIVYPEDSLVWRPLLRLVIYIIVARAFTISGADLVRRYRKQESYQVTVASRLVKTPEGKDAS